MQNRQRVIVSNQRQTTKSQPRVEVEGCGPCGDYDRRSWSHDDRRKQSSCRPITFDCDCTDIELGCIDSSSSAGQSEIESALGDVGEILLCVNSLSETDLTESNVTVTDLPASWNGDQSSQIRIFTVTDDEGRSASLIRTVTWRETSDANLPEAICPADRTVACGTAIRFDAPVFVDACGSTCNLQISPRPTRPDYDETIDERQVLANGNIQYTRTWTVTDACDRTSTCSQTITELCRIQPTGCTALYWLGEDGVAGEGQVFWSNDENNILPRNHFFTFESLPRDIFDLPCGTLDNVTREDLREQNDVECGDLMEIGIVALLNAAAYPETYNFPRDATDFDALHDLIRDTIIAEYGNPATNDLCLELAAELEDANNSVCEPSVAVTGCNLAYWQSAAALQLFDQPTRQLVLNMQTNIRFTTQTDVRSWLQLNDPNNLLTDVTIEDLLTGNVSPTACLGILQPTIVALLNITVNPRFDYPFSTIDPSVRNLTTLRTYIRNQLNTYLGNPSSTICNVNAGSLNEKLLAANQAFCQLVNPPAPAAKQFRRAAIKPAIRSGRPVKRIVTPLKKTIAPKRTVPQKKSTKQSVRK